MSTTPKRDRDGNPILREEFGSKGLKLKKLKKKLIDNLKFSYQSKILLEMAARKPVILKLNSV